MADNYIEKQYEKYEARKAAWKNGLKNIHTHANHEAKENISENETKTKRRVFITGGASGIGKAIVEYFSNNGDIVAFCDNNVNEGRKTGQKYNAMFFNLDVSNFTALTNCMNRLLKEWGDIDVIVNNVGISKFSDITETSVESFEKTLSVNLTPVFVTSRLLAIHRKSLSVQNQYGRIVNICSTRYLMSEEGTEAYSASKGGIYSLTHSLAVSLSKYNITVNSISPGWIENNNYSLLKESDHLQHPSNRVGKPEDIARLCMFICDEENDFINGENITVDGGMTKKMIYV